MYQNKDISNLFNNIGKQINELLKDIKKKRLTKADYKRINSLHEELQRSCDALEKVRKRYGRLVDEYLNKISISQNGVLFFPGGSKKEISYNLSMIEQLIKYSMVSNEKYILEKWLIQPVSQGGCKQVLGADDEFYKKKIEHLKKYKKYQQTIDCYDYLIRRLFFEL